VAFDSVEDPVSPESGNSQPPRVFIDADGLHVRAITPYNAEPAFAILLEQAGLTPPNSLTVAEAWQAFQLFMQLPTVGRDEGASFQTEIFAEGERQAAVRFVRQVGAPDGADWSEAVAVQFLFSTFPTQFRPLEVWSQDIGDFSAFVAHVEALPEFSFAAAAVPDQSLLYMAESRETD
jgi:hypothetical protein